MASSKSVGGDAAARRVDDGSDSEDSDAEGGVDLFADPPGYYPSTPPPTTEQHALGRSGVQLTLHLVGHSVLEAHRLWNGSRVLADYLEEEEEKRADGDKLVRGKTVLELGAGAGLPSIVCGLVLGARRVVVTDYPDPDLVATMRQNIGLAEASPGGAAMAGVVTADGYVWGADAAPLVAQIAPDSGFDVLLLADLLFRHAEHAKIAQSVAQTLKRAPASRAYVFFTSYRPWLRHKDLAFFQDACAAGLVVEHLLERRLQHPPLFFADDPGDVAVRSTVSGYVLRWPVAGETPEWHGETEAEADAAKAAEAANPESNATN